MRKGLLSALAKILTPTRMVLWMHLLPTVTLMPPHLLRPLSCYHFWFFTVKEGDLLHAWQGVEEEVWRSVERSSQEGSDKNCEKKSGGQERPKFKRKRMKERQTRTQRSSNEAMHPDPLTSSGIHLAEVCEASGGFDIPSSVRETSSMVVSIPTLRSPYLSPLVEGLPQSEAPSELLLGMSQAKMQQQQQQKKKSGRKRSKKRLSALQQARQDRARNARVSVERLRLRSRSARSDSALSDGTDSDSSSTPAVDEENGKVKGHGAVNDSFFSLDCKSCVPHV